MHVHGYMYTCILPSAKRKSLVYSSQVETIYIPYIVSEHYAVILRVLIYDAKFRNQIEIKKLNFHCFIYFLPLHKLKTVCKI